MQRTAEADNFVVHQSAWQFLQLVSGDGQHQAPSRNELNDHKMRLSHACAINDAPSVFLHAVLSTVTVTQFLLLNGLNVVYRYN